MGPTVRQSSGFVGASGWAVAPRVNLPVCGMRCERGEGEAL